VLNGPVSGQAPDARVSLPASIDFIEFTGTHLILGQDLGVANQNRIFIYTPADLLAAAITPSVSILLPPPVGMVNVVMRGLVIHGGDIYVYSIYDDGMPNRTFGLVTHVFRDVASLTSGAAPNATIAHASTTTSGIFIAHESIAVNDDVLAVTGFGRLFLSLAPANLIGNAIPDRELVLESGLEVGSTSFVALSATDLYLYSTLVVAAFANPATVDKGELRRFTLAGPSIVLAVPGTGIVQLGSRLFTLSLFHVSPLTIVGFDVGGPVAQFAPPNVALGPPTFGQQVLDGAADVLIAGTTLPGSGVVAGYANASTIVDSALPSFYLFDFDLLEVKEVRAAEQ